MTELNNTSPNLSALALLRKNAYFLPVGANFPPRPMPSLLLLIQPFTGLHLLQNPVCTEYYDDSRFSILAQGRSPFHLSALEATIIKTLNPDSCRQKEIVYSLQWRSFIGLFPANHGSTFSCK